MKTKFSLFAVFVCTLSVFGAGANLFSQTRDTSKVVQKESRLDSVTVSAYKRPGPVENKKFALGTNVISVSREAIAKMQSSTLAEFIKSENAAYIKEYGKGMGAFISVRGTSSSHTTIDWNGQSMSVPTMGQADLSHVPVYFFDAMDIHIGGSSALYGDGSIGGSIRLKTRPKWEKGSSGDILLSGGSFGSFFTGATYRYSAGKLETRSSLFYNRATNDYTFKNNTKPGLPVERLNNAALSNMGFLQELYARTKRAGTFSLSLMYLDFSREIQPSVSLNDRPESYASIYDKNFKASASLNGSGNTISWNIAASYAYDHETYKEDIIAAHRILSSADAEFRKGQLTVKGGISGEYILPRVHSYADSVSEKRAGAFLLARFEGEKLFSASAGLRYLYSSGNNIPLMPSLNARLRIPLSSTHSLSVRASFSGNAKVPSLNDRYWGGNYVYLKSESSFTAEGGADYSWYRDGWGASLFATAYRSKVYDWIRWLPAGQVWRPRNIPEVLSRGAEAGAKITVRAGTTDLSLTANYAYTNIITVEPLWSEDPARGEQLAYQPRHSWRAMVKGERGKFSVFAAMSYTGRRTTLDIYDVLPSYLLTDAGATFRQPFGDNELVLSATVKNIFNVSYQNVKFYAMPGTNGQLTVQFRF